MSHPNKQIVNRTIHIQEVRNSDHEDTHQVQQSENEPIATKKNQDHQDKQNKQEKPEEPRQEKKHIDGVTIFCKICDDFIAHSVTTVCEHTFCELCLIEYMIFIDQCPQCNARIRNQRLTNNILLDNLIMEYIQKYEPQEVEIFQQRLQRLKNYQKDKKLNQFQAGIKVDVRNTDYVWCTGRITRTVNKFQDKKVKWMMVKYDKTNNKEEFPENSPRIAPFGFYTSRKDIPKYQKRQLILENEEENIIYKLPHDNDQQEQKQAQQNDS